MSKCISYSLFGYGQEQNQNCFTFNSYLTSLGYCLRMNAIIYPDWETVVHIDRPTYDGFKSYWDKIQNEKIRVVICSPAPLCLAMLWRLKPVFERNYDSSVGGYTDWKYTHVICRDLDSPSPYREAQCVAEWIEHDKAAHAITDSISHTIPLMGGLIGFRPAYIAERLGCLTWDELISRANGINFDQKGSDQDFLNREIYPRIARQGNDSITQHYLLGCANTFLSDYHNRIPEIELSIGEEMKESNDSCCHLGQSGWLLPPTWKFFDKHKDKFTHIEEAEKEFPNVFYWIEK